MLLDEVAANIDDLTRRIDAGAPRRRPPDSFGSKSWSEPLPQGIVGAYDDRPFSGRSSPGGSTSKCTAVAMKWKAC